MRITLIGKGRTGSVIRRVAERQGHRIVHVASRECPIREDETGAWVAQTEVLIDFSVPEATGRHLRFALGRGLPIVIGTTGWDAERARLGRQVEAARGACVFASNFSPGVQVFLRLAQEASRLASRVGDLEPFLLELHHSGKRDAPSGTALRLQRRMKAFYPEVPVTSLRAGHFPGSHRVVFDGPSETFTLEHVARNREAFARGALLAAEWIRGRHGFHSFEEVLFGEERE